MTMRKFDSNLFHSEIMEKLNIMFCHSKFQQNLGFWYYKDADPWELKKIDIQVT